MTFKAGDSVELVMPVYAIGERVRLTNFLIGSGGVIVGYHRRSGPGRRLVVAVDGLGDTVILSPDEVRDEDVIERMATLDG